VVNKLRPGGPTSAERALPTSSSGDLVPGPQLARQKRSGPSRPELNRAAWAQLRRAVRQRDGHACRNCGATKADGLRLSVHHLIPVALGGRDELSNLLLLCSRCHPLFEKAARTLTLPIEQPARTRTAKRRTNRDRYASHPAPYRGPDGQPWSRQWYEY
jgi:hypothetical protein